MDNPIKMDDLGVPYFWKHPYLCGTQHTAGTLKGFKKGLVYAGDGNYLFQAGIMMALDGTSNSTTSMEMGCHFFRCSPRSLVNILCH